MKQNARVKVISQVRINVNKCKVMYIGAMPPLPNFICKFMGSDLADSTTEKAIVWANSLLTSERRVKGKELQKSAACL